MLLRKKFFHLALFATITLPAFSALAQDTSPTLKKIKDAGTIVLGYREASVPLSYGYNDGKEYHIAGYAIDLCQKMVDEIRAELKMPHLKVAYKAVRPGTRIPMIADGSIDIECGSSTNNVQRQRYVSFSMTYYIAGIRLASKAGSNINALRDLSESQLVVATEGSSGSRLMDRLNTGRKNESFSLTLAKDHAESFQMLESGKVVAFANDDILLHGLLSTSKTPGDFVISDEALSVEPYGAMIPKDDRLFKEIIDRALRKTFESGEIETIYTKWFMKPIPPKNIALNMPITPQLSKIFKQPIDQSDPQAYK